MVSRSHRFALLAIAFTFAGMSFGAPTPVRFVPAKGETIKFLRIYSGDHLKNHPLQMTKKTEFVLKNSKGLLTGTWNSTIRDIRTDEALELSATGICKAHSSRKIECTFDAATGSVNLTAQKEGLSISIPAGQGVFFSKEKDGVTHSEILLGADEDNNAFDLKRK